VKITYLDRNREKKMKKGGFMSKIDLKPPLNKETERENRRENLKRKIRAGLLKRKQKLIIKVY